VNGKQLRRYGGGDMHRSAIHADGETSRANEPDELQKGGLVRQIHAVIRCGDPPHCSSDEHYASGRKRAAKVFDYRIAQ
jgi:hypothetical protein